MKTGRVQAGSLGRLARITLMVAPLLGGLFYTSTTRATDLVFDGNVQLVSGSDCETGAKYRFGTSASVAGKPLDVLVELVDDDNDITSVTSTSGTTYKCLGLIRDDPADPELFTVIGNDGPDNGDETEPWSVDMRFTFVEKGTETPVAIDRLPVTVFDLDRHATYLTGADSILLTDRTEPILSANTLLRESAIDMTLADGTRYTRMVSGTSQEDCSPESKITCRVSFTVSNQSGFSIRVFNNKSAPGKPRLFQFAFTADWMDEMIAQNQGRSATTPTSGEIRTGLDGSGIGALGWWVLPALPIAWRQRRKSLRTRQNKNKTIAPVENHE